jgi:hypothetical protein
VVVSQGNERLTDKRKLRASAALWLRFDRFGFSLLFANVTAVASPASRSARNAPSWRPRLTFRPDIPSSKLSVPGSFLLEVSWRGVAWHFTSR